MNYENLYGKKIRGGIRWIHKTIERLENELCLERYGYKVYSQNDEDGIIEEIFSRIGTTNKYFIEFGVQNGLESNTHYLLHKGWQGLWIEGSSLYCSEIQYRFRPVIENKKLCITNAFITRDNINHLIGENVRGEIDLLSIDIDGNDYHVWKAIDVINPRVVVIEYNAKFTPDVEWVMGYCENHVWKCDDWHGASLKALENLGREKGYQLVGTNISGSNAFFVRNDLTGNLFYLPATAEELYSPMGNGWGHICGGHKNNYCLADQKEGFGIEELMKEGRKDGVNSQWNTLFQANKYVILYGTGTDAEGIYEELSDDARRKVLFCDARAKQGEYIFQGKVVMNPDVLLDITREFPILITSSQYHKEIEESLLAKGIKKERIQINKNSYK